MKVNENYKQHKKQFLISDLLCRLLSPELEKFFAYAENPAGLRVSVLLYFFKFFLLFTIGSFTVQLSGDDIISATNNILKIVTSNSETS